MAAADNTTKSETDAAILKKENFLGAGSFEILSCIASQVFSDAPGL